MYAVFQHESLVYLGNCRDEAFSFVDGVEGATLHNVNSLEELADLVNLYDHEIDLEETVQTVGEQLSEAANVVVQKLDAMGLNAQNAEDLAKKLRDGGEKTLAEVRSLGIKGMKAVGEGFVALGELLRKADAKPESDKCDEHGPGCCGGH